ncbi:MAG: biotin attachment protein [Deltaproteobacteria bacterium]|jgi:pyruvate carboxylase subunit B|nr:biotin attachment protein [Deltaproteobacteria bacterium]MBW2497240.1 biotin attachment protein [Deltaproteobacteria bacterium]
MAKKLVSVMNTSFRDGFQSVYGARVRTADFLPALEASLEAGFTHFEAGGGARYQSLYLYCQEDAFDMMDAFRATTGPDANLQTLARGVNVVGLDSQSSDIIDLHARLFKKHGMTTIRNFDALNDVRNLSYSGRCITEAGLNHEVTIALMELPPGCVGAHTPDFYMKVLEGILDDGVPFDSICFKDASGTAVPSKVYDTIKLARQRLGSDVHIRLHTHETAGVSVGAYVAALEAGADGIDLAMAPVSGGTSQPDVIVMWHALRGTEYDLGLDIDKVVEAESVFKECMKDYFLPPEATAVEPLIPYSPMPGGALTANTQMMRDAGTLDQFPAVIQAMSDVVRKGGFGSSVTPVSQFYFQQAYNNVVLGPWKRIAEGYGKMVLGYFGKTPVPPDPEVVALAREQLELEPTTRNPREINDEDPAKGMEAARRLLADKELAVTEESIFIASALKEKGIAFLQGERPDGVRKVEPEAPKPAVGVAKPIAYAIELGGHRYEVALGGGKARVNGRVYDYVVGEAAGTGDASPGTAAAPSGSGELVLAELAGQVLRVLVSEGERVDEGDVLVVLEALKMEIEVKAPCTGVVSAILVCPDQTVATGDALVEIGS